MRSTQWNPLNEVNLLSKFHFSSFCITGDFQNGRFAYLEQFQIISYSSDFVKVKMDPICSFLLTWGRLVILLTFGKKLGCEKQSLRQKIQELRIGSGTSRFQWFNHQESRAEFLS